VSAPELSVVCKSCGSEVSPYVTECPYCGTRLRRRAPKLERRGDELAARQRRRLRAPRLARLAVTHRPYATLAAVLGPAVLLLVQRAAELRSDEVGAIVGGVGSEWWRYLAAPFVYTDLGYLFVAGVTVAVFAPALERRLGPVPAALLIVACGALGMLGAVGLDSIGIGEDPFVAAGGNGIALGVLAAWLAIRHAESRSQAGDDYDWIGAAVFAAALLALPLVESSASVFAGIFGGLVGAAAGLATSAAGPAEGR
jgi:membrane associated rhomboid family serine protease